MKLCGDHWEKLREAIDARGLSRFVSASGEEVARRVHLEMCGDRGPDSFDPLMAANFAIWGNAVGIVGPYVMLVDGDGREYCPICEAVACGAHGESWWIDNAAEEQLQRARALGLVGREGRG